MKLNRILPVLAAVALSLAAATSAAQTIKIGFVGTYSGPGAAAGDQLDKGVKLYMKLNGDKLPPGVKVEIITRDDTGPNPDVAKRISQEPLSATRCSFSPVLSGPPTWPPSRR
jgi:branched-chain amino acid transport system substrate-binding protein